MSRFRLTMSAQSDVTRLLIDWTNGDAAALDALAPLVYAELRRIADGYLRRERRTQRLAPTEVVHEAWLRLAAASQLRFEHRQQFYGLAAQVIRRILVDHARRTGADKRGGDVRFVTLDDAPGVTERITELLALDQALDRLARVHPRQARVVELRHFAGLGVEDIGQLLGVSAATVSRDPGESLDSV